ncbi:unnamed protein product [Blepharisma stoltei]|uniref:Ras-GAP domain-containing protein n=1 Tax=Blepharisma stoltei TaxID=1481888 RepID=A0AAU9JBI8_9CILI|nr:unnamed protein product [Blepharisma stoltei]
MISTADSSNVHFLPPKRIACGHQFSSAINDAGEIFVWGCNKNGKLALDSGPEPIWRPKKIDIASIGGSANQIDCGAEFTMVISLLPEDKNEAGKLIGWGVNNMGQVGIGNDDIDELPNEVREPTLIRLPEKACRVSCGRDFAACITESGRLYSWGNGTYGNLGHGSTDSYSKPTIVQALSDTIIIGVSCGAKHVLITTKDFKVYSWGNGGHGRLGHGDTIGTATPKPIEYLFRENIMYVSAGDSHSAAVSNLGEVYSWGAGSYGRLGHGSEIDVQIPSIVTALQGKRMYMVACGFRHSLSISVQGEVFAWGAGNYGVTGLFDLKEIRTMLIPLQIRFLEGKKITQVAVGPWHSMAISSAGEVFTWGYHGHGRLGHGTDARDDQAFPKAIPPQFIYGVTGGVRIIERIAQITGSKKLMIRNTPARDAWKMIQVACGGQHSLAVTKSGTVWAWGENRNGALGVGKNEEDQLVPVICQNLNNYIIKSVACGSQHSLAISTRGEVLTWGNGRFGQLGNGFAGICFIPKIVEMLQGKGIIQGACGEDYSAVLSEIGEVYTFGNSDSGKLGLGRVPHQVFPKLIRDLLNISYISAGQSHMAVIGHNGAVYTWGSGFYGKLGNGSSENLFSPKQIHGKGERIYKMVSCGASHTLFLDEKLVLYGAGRKEMVLSRVDLTEPKLIGNLHDKTFRLICAAEEHSLAITEQGDTFIWGFNKYGKLGNKAENEPLPQPFKLPLPSNICDISAKINHNLVLTTNGDIYAWGCGSGGRLGFGNTNNIKTPEILETRWNAIQESANFDDEQDELNALDLVLSQLDTGVRISSFKEMMLVLQNEEEDCLESELRREEAEVHRNLAEIVKTFKTSKESEERIHDLKIQIEGKILQRTYELKLPQRDYLIVHIPKYLASNLGRIENMIWILQQQPCYISRLVNIMRQRGSRDISTLITSIRPIYSNIHLDAMMGKLISRDSLLYISLCKEVIAGEIENANMIDDLFVVPGCPTAQFLLSFFSRDYGSDLFYKILHRPTNELLDMVKAIGNNGIVIDPIEVSRLTQRQGSGQTANSVIKEKKAQSAFNDGITYAIRAAGYFIDTIKAFPSILPTPIKILMKHTFSKMANKAWLREVGHEHARLKFQKALLRLMITQLLLPVIMTPETEGLTTQTIEEGERDTMSIITDIIRKIVDKTCFIGDHYSTLNSFILTSHEQLISTLETCIEVEDSSEVDLIISSFTTHFSVIDSFIHYPVNDIITLSIYLIKYRKQVELFPGRDLLYDHLDHMSDIGSEVAKSADNFKINLQMNNHFLYDYDEVSVCAGCGVPMPKSLAITTRTHSTLIKHLHVREEDEFLVSIENASRQIPKFSAITLEELSTKFRKTIESILSTPNPNYKILFELRAADEKVQDLMSRDFSMDYLLFELSKRLKDRHSYKQYLRRLQEGIHHITAAQEEYFHNLREKEKDLTAALDTIANFRTSLHPNEKEMKNMSYFKLSQTHNLVMKKRKILDLPADVQHDVAGNVSIVTLENNGVIERLEYGFRKDTKNSLELHYSHHKKKGWHFEIIFNQGESSDMIGQFNLSNEEFLNLKRSANSEAKLDIPNIGTFRLGPFIIFLNSRVRKQVV